MRRWFYQAKAPLVLTPGWPISANSGDPPPRSHAPVTGAAAPARESTLDPAIFIGRPETNQPEVN